MYGLRNDKRKGVLLSTPFLASDLHFIVNNLLLTS
jgi:hypothetical protein